MAKSNLTLRHNSQRGYGVYALSPINQGEIMPLEGQISPRYFVEHDRYFQLTEDFIYEWVPGMRENYLNHSCNPNCFIKVIKGIPSLITKRNIKSNEELCYNYNTVMYDLEKNWASFPCHCKSSKCIGRIRGFLYLTPNEEKEIESMLTPFILSKMKEHIRNRL